MGYRVFDPEKIVTTQVVRMEFMQKKKDMMALECR
jgi:hypothetical protein